MISQVNYHLAFMVGFSVSLLIVCIIISLQIIVTTIKLKVIKIMDPWYDAKKDYYRVG